MAGTAHRRIDHVHKDEGVGIVPVSVGAGLSVFLRLDQILLLNDFFAFDHAASAVRAFVLALHSAGAAAGTGLIVHDLGADDLLFCVRGSRIIAEACAARDPADEFHDEDDRQHKE